MKLKRFFCILLGMMVFLSCMTTVPAQAESQQTTLHYTVLATVIYRDYDGTQTVQKVETGSFLKEPQPKGKQGYTFEGWRNEKTGMLWNFSDPVTEHLTLVASYTKTSGNSGSSGSSSGGSSGSHNVSQIPQTSQPETAANEETTKNPEDSVTETAAAKEETNAESEKSDDTEMISDEKWKTRESQSENTEQNKADSSEEMAWKGRPLTKTISVEHGIISFRIEVEAEGIGVKLEISPNEFLNMLQQHGMLSEKDWQSVTQGETMEIVLLVQDTGTEISEQSRSEMEKNSNGYIIGQYLDISLFKYYGNRENGQKITETPEPLTISLQVPDDLINTDDQIERIYIILRNHNGVVEILDSTYQEDSHIITFQTSQFSDYAIAYQDVRISENNEAQEQNTQKVTEILRKTDDASQTMEHDRVSSPIHYGIAVLIFIIIILILLYIRKKKKEEED